MNTQDLRLTLLIQILTILLVIKSIASTYFASYYSIMGYEDLVWKYAHSLNWIALLLIIPLALISLTLVLPISENKRRYLEITSLVITLIIVLVSFFFF